MVEFWEFFAYSEFKYFTIARLYQYFPYLWLVFLLTPTIFFEEQTFTIFDEVN